MVSDSQQGQTISQSVNHMHVATMDRTVKHIQDIMNKMRTPFSPDI